MFRSFIFPADAVFYKNARLLQKIRLAGDVNEKSVLIQKHFIGIDLTFH